jgi:predicted aconitase
MDLGRWREMGVSPGFACQQLRVLEALSSMGVALTCTCTPYLIGYAPQEGDHLAWSESSAVSFANSVLGAHTNREGGPSALAAAIIGRTAAYGLHLSANRRATHIVNVDCSLSSEADYGALGYMVGQKVRDGVPCFRFRQPSTPHVPPREALMALGAAMAASGAVALYHMWEAVPEEREAVMPSDEIPTITVRDLGEGHAELNSPLDRIDFVSVGCPHATLADLERIAMLLGGRPIKATLWVTTSREIRSQAEQRGLVTSVEQCGAKVFADTCLVVAPMEEMGFRAMATNSAKAAFYSPAHSGLQRRFGTMEQCVEAAVTGYWGESGGDPRG